MNSEQINPKHNCGGDSVKFGFTNPKNIDPIRRYRCLKCRVTFTIKSLNRPRGKYSQSTVNEAVASVKNGSSYHRTAKLFKVATKTVMLWCKAQDVKSQYPQFGVYVWPHPRAIKVNQ